MELGSCLSIDLLSQFACRRSNDFGNQLVEFVLIVRSLCNRSPASCNVSRILQKANRICLKPYSS